MKHYFLGMVLLVTQAACNNNTPQKETAADTATVFNKVDTAAGVTPDPMAAAPVITQYKTKSGKTFTLETTHPAGASLCNVKVVFNGSADSTAFALNDIDPVSKVMVADLDANGFDELFIVTTAAGSGTAGNVYGFASNKDKSMSQVYIPAIEDKDLAKGGPFEGYEGHDEFEIVENALARRFPIKADKATMRTISYKMKKGETGYVLYVKTATAF